MLTLNNQDEFSLLAMLEGGYTQDDLARMQALYRRLDSRRQMRRAFNAMAGRAAAKQSELRLT